MPLVRIRFYRDLGTHDCGGAELAMTVRAFLIPKRALPACWRWSPSPPDAVSTCTYNLLRTMAKSDFFGDERSARLPVEARSPAATFTKTLISTPEKSAATREGSCRFR